jgi:hypothetical protein
LEFQEDSANYQISNDTICYYCGKSYSTHNINIGGGREYEENTDDVELHNEDDNDNDNDSDDETNSTAKEYNRNNNNIHGPYNITQSDSSTVYENKKKKVFIPFHKFYPATFVKLTGGTSDDLGDVIPEEKLGIIRNYFNNPSNIEGKHVKLILGSKVVGEGFSFYNVYEVHILDVHFNLARVDQVVGRAIRWCSHMKTINENNIFPKVDVYKYVVSLPDKLSSEEELYQKAELKHELIKKVERVLREVSIDCSLNYNSNIFKEDLIKYKDCEKTNNCPAQCDYTNCQYKCANQNLNNKYYDYKNNTYIELNTNDLDNSTFSNELVRSEVKFAKNIV